MSEEHRKDVPQIAITAYESTEEDAEVNSLFNSTTVQNNTKTRQSQSVSPKSLRLKSRIILKSPTPDNNINISKSLSPALSSDFNYLTDVEVMSDSDDEKDFVRTPRLTPSSIDYCILTDIEDLSEDERQPTSSQINDDHTDTEYFDEEKCFLSKEEPTRQHADDILDFPRPHREILFHSKDGVVRTLTPTDETNLVCLKTPLVEIKGFESEEEIMTMEENDVHESSKANSTPYYHDVDGGVVESSESVKPERNKHKYKTIKKKIVVPETDCIKKRFRNRNQNNSEGEENIGKQFGECDKTLSKYASEPITNKMAVPLQLQLKNNNLTEIRYEESCKNNKLVIHDNVNGFSVSVDFESHNSILLNIGRDSGSLSLRWYNNETKAGLSAFKVFSREHEAKHKSRKKIVLESRKHVADVIQIFENMCDNPSVSHTVNYKTSQHYYKDPQLLTLRQNVSFMAKSNNKIGKEANFSQLENAKPITSSEPSPELTTNTTNIVHQISIDKIPPKPNPRNSIDSSIKSTLDQNDENYSTKKQFWEEITKTTNQPPLPKPRYSISLPINTIERSIMKNSSLEINDKSFGTSEQTEMPEMVKETMTSDQTTNNDVVSDSTCLTSKDDNEKYTFVIKCKMNESNRLDSETEYIIKYGEESLAFENEGFQEDVFEEKVLDGAIENMSSKQYFKLIKQMECIQMEQESSPEHKSLKNTTNQKSPSQEALINRQIHKHIFSDELDEQIDSLIPEEKHFDIKFEKDFSSSSPFNTQTEKATSSISEQSITKTESSIVDELPEEKENKLISKHLKYSSSLTQDHIDEIPSDTCSGVEEKEKSHLQTESIDSSMIEELQYDCSSNLPEEGNRKSRTDIIKGQIIHTPEEHIPDTIWEVTQIGTDNQNELEDLNIKEQTEFHRNFVKKVDSIDSIESTKKEMTDDLARDIAEQLVNEIEIELTKRQDILANLQHLVVSPEHLKQLENSGYLDMDGDDLKLKIMESVLAKKNRDRLKSISKNDTTTSSIEITDEDLKSSNFEIEYEGLTKLSVIDDIIPENENDRLRESPTEINSKYRSEHSSREENEEFCEKSDNLIIEAYIKNKENEKSVHSEVEQNEELSTGKIRNESVSNKNHKDLTTNVGENLILNLNEEKIEIKEIGLHDESSDENSSHDVVQSIQTRKDETGEIIEQKTTEIVDHESHTRNFFDVETEHNEHSKNHNISIKEKHVDTILKDSDEMVKKKNEKYEEITDDGRIIINVNKEEHHSSTYILKETSINNKNEITISNNDSPSCSSKSIMTLVKHLSTESLPSKDNSIHSPTSPSSSSIDVREEKHVNFDSVVLRKPDSINVTKLTAKRPADSSSSESHYQSFDLTSSSRPCSSDIDGLLAGSSEYESAMSIPSNDYHTAISSLSSRESMKSLDSESSGNLASVENSEASETLIASTGDLDYDIDVSNNLLEEENKLEPYEQEIPMQIIRGDSLPIIAEQSEMKYSSMYKTQPFSQPTISANSEKNVQKMKRSHEMMFHPIPKHITSDSLSDSSSHEERHQSSESMSISSTEGQIIQTVIDAIEGFSESGPCSFSLSDENTRSIETSTITNGFTGQEKNQDITIMSSSSAENGKNNNVSTQITTKVEEVPKKGHRRNSSSINKIVIEDINLIPKKEFPIADPSIENVTSSQTDIPNQNQDTEENIATQEKVKIVTPDIKTEISVTTRYHETEIHASPILEKHSFEHIDDVAEADAAFQMVPHVSPAIPTSLPPTIPEDPYSEDEDELEDDSSNLVPNIMVTEHMNPLVDRGFHYPDLDLEAKELEIKSTPETPASISSKESSETDQGREYIINETFNPHEELSWTADEHTVLEKVEQIDEKDSFSMSESFELVDNVDEKPDLEDDFVIVEEIGKEANEEDAEGQPIKIECTAKNVHSYTATDDNSSLKKLDSESLSSKEQELDLEYANQKWVELQFEDDNTVNEIYGYNLEYDRLPLEDIKEEDIEDLHSSKVGSVSSQVSQSIGSLGSMKESFSSTPESKKYLGKSLEHDNMSVSSLQEFERLEQLVRIESMKAKSSGSLASTTSSSNSKKEDQSLGSLNDFEAMEAACIQTEIIENKAMATEKSLIDDENQFKTNDTGKQTEINVEQYDDNSEKLVSEDDNLTSTESLDLKTIVTDMKPSSSVEQIIVDGRTNDYDDCMNSSISSRGLSSPIMDDHSKESSYRNSLILGSNDSLGPTSSTGTNATYHCETGSNMSSSFTSGGSNTMVSSMEGLDKAGTKPDLLEDPEIFETHWRDPDGTEYTHRTVRMPAEIHKVTARGPEKENILDDYIEQFSPGEYQEQTIHTDKHGNTYATKIVQKRMIFDPEELSNQGISKEELKECLKKLSSDHSDEFEYSKTTPKRNSGTAEKCQETSVPDPHNELQEATSKPELKCEISMDDDTEIDLREHDWRFQHQINTESEDITKPGPSGCTSKPKSEGQNSETVSEL
ncbi:uncharacterized protein LOC126846128 isoform X1 [Adelges cooleyi]|uniref:uncharacterized protein LOC126846128 isoform X1 n=1 Tax=Adelges cooleyi TaxID=133065 RepID=UPI00217FEAE2|nr:uncharacterized protein LOC126846128 isoform X1 [Adelges cooleyi]